MAFDWSKLLILPAAEDEKSAQLAPIAAPATGVVQPVAAGRAFHKLQYNVEDAPEEEEEAGGEDPLAAKKEELRTKLDSKNLDLEDYYALMGLGEIGWKATEEQIEANWKILSFVCHPDKSSNETRPYGEKRFKAMQLAFKTLTDKQKRIGYDSQLPFDEVIPDAGEGAGSDFYEVYAPVFERNSRFSEKKPVPALGDKDTPDEEVGKFYDFWFGFKSWRDFTYLDEHKNDDATDRFTKRENDRKNLKLRAGKKREEMARVRQLVEGAQKKDPRVQAQRQKEIDAKQAIKDTKQAKKQAILDAQLEKERLAKEAVDAEKNKADAERKRKSDLTKLKKKFKKVVKRIGSTEAEDVAAVVASATNEQFEEMNAAMGLHMGPTGRDLNEEEIKAARALFDAAVEATLSPEKVAARQAKAKAAEEEAAAAAAAKAAAAEARTTTETRDWLPEEDRILAAAFKKYIDRWPVMTDLVNDANLGYTRTKKEVIKRCKEIEAGLVTIAAEEPKAAPAAAKPAPAPAEAAAKPAAKKAAKVAPADDGWSVAQQKALEAALLKVPKSTAKRFEVIAPLVPGKNKKQCVERFKQLRAKVMAKKGGEPARTDSRPDWVYDEEGTAVPNYVGYDPARGW